MMTETKLMGVFQVLRDIFHLLLNFFSFPVEVLLRRKYGERYYKFLTVLIMFGLLNVLASGLVASNFADSFPMAGNSNILLIFTYVFLVVGTYHRFVIWNRKRKGGRWHSKFIGEPLPFFLMIPKVDRMKIYRFVEPVFILTIAFAMSFIDSMFAIYLTIAGLGLFFIANAHYKKMRNEQLDMIDAEIESTNISAAMEERPTAETEGFALTGAKNLAPKLKTRLASKITKQHKIDEAIQTAIVNPLAVNPLVENPPPKSTVDLKQER